MSSAYAQQPTLSVKGPSNEAVGPFRWLIEEDVNQDVIPGQTCQAPNYAGCMGLEFQKSNMPVVAKGTDADPLPNLDPAKRYYISVLPNSGGVDGGYTNGGAKISAGQTAVSVLVQKNPLPTAQIRVFVYNDNYPINAQPDTPEETGIQGFSIKIEDTTAGEFVSTDVYGNPLGTTYDPATGNVVTMGDGTITTDADGIALIKNLAPGKYGVNAIPPAGSDWIQTFTVEGKHAQDSWVKANEPAYFVEFGPPGPHVSIGFVKKFDNTASLAGATRTTISGQVRSIHNSRPPNFAFHTGAPVPNCWVGLNSLATGVGQGVYAQPCGADSKFSIQNVPPGEYQLVIWDKALDYIFASKNVTVDPGGTCNGGSCDLLDVPVFSWFARLEQYVFNDTNENGFWDVGEAGMNDQGTNIRMRNGSIYQSYPTDLSGAVPYDEVFPFFAWIVPEVNYDRFKATGATVVVDDGGPIDPTDPWSFGGVLHPQPQTVANGAPYEGAPYRTETGPVLTQAYQGFLGQTNVIMWGKKPYGPGENGGITGIVYYAVTRAENDPQYAAAETWEPGIPRIQVALYEDMNADGVIDDKNGVAGVQIADVDNYPFGWKDGTAPKGDEDFDYNGNGTFDQGDAIQVTYTDSWDDNLPTGCGETFRADGVYPVECYDGLRAFNQVRPGVFDGGYAFSGIPAGTYIVGTGEHTIYETLKEEDKNVDYGQTYTVPAQLPPSCVGDDHVVAATYTLFNDGTPAAAGQVRKLCDRKQVILTDGKNAAADFFMFTQVPIAGHIVGFILDDTTNEFDPNAPTFGEKYAPPYMPISIRDWSGKEISRTYSDRWGNYNALVPSSYTTNIPHPSGVSPNVLTACMNDPGPLPNGQIDPYYKRQYSQFCYTLQYLPGLTTYLDTPVVPVAAFTGPNPNTLDCRVPDGTPVIWSATGPTVAGPYLANANEVLTIVAAQDTATGRDLGFGASQGQILLDGVPLPAASIQSWDANIITVQIPASGNLEIARADGKKTENGIHVTVGGGAIVVPAGGSIQSAIDTASAGDLVIVPEGSYKELVIMWKPVRLQGVGAATSIGAEKVPAEKLQTWRDAVASLVSGANPSVDLLPLQETGNGLFEPLTLSTEQGPGVIVLAKKNGANSYAIHPSRIDGLTIAGSDQAGGIVVNAYATNLEISNNRIFGNSGIYSGGIRVGHPIFGEANANTNINIHNNYVAENAATMDTSSAGGGISLYMGSENYQVRNNYVCGNYTQGEGGGIGHLGLSHDGVIANNKILFNQSFTQGMTNSGGGIFVGGLANATGLTDGAGSVTIDSNLIQGNEAGAGDGGGIRLALVNGNDVAVGGANNPSRWHHITINNNMVVNNVAGLAGGAISMQDAASVEMTNNTVVNNNSTATAGDAFAPNRPNQSTPQPAGIVAHAHSDALAASFGNRIPPELTAFSNPTMYNNIVMDNRSFYFLIDKTQDPAVFGLQPAGMTDFAVIGATGNLVSNNGLTTGDTTTGDLFVLPYVNTGSDQVIQQIELTTSIATQPAFDEGGNYIRVNYGPIHPVGDYHIKAGSAAIDAGNGSVAPATDIDGDARPQGAGVDIGADEAQ